MSNSCLVMWERLNVVLARYVAMQVGLIVHRYCHPFEAKSALVSSPEGFILCTIFSGL